MNLSQHERLGALVEHIQHEVVSLHGTMPAKTLGSDDLMWRELFQMGSLASQHIAEEDPRELRACLIGIAGLCALWAIRLEENLNEAS